MGRTEYGRRIYLQPGSLSKSLKEKACGNRIRDNFGFRDGFMSGIVIGIRGVNLMGMRV